MSRLSILLSLLAATTLSAATIRFDPPNPTSRTPVMVHLVGPFSSCTPSLQRSGASISITLANCGLPTQGTIVDVPVDLGVLAPGVYDVGVGVPTLLIGIADATLVVQDAAPPFQLTPNVGLFATDVTITGHDLPANPVVKFGDVAVTVLSASPDKIVVRVPMHEPAIVDVTVGNLKSTAAFEYVEDGLDPNPAFYAPVLFPIAGSAVGAYGSLWSTAIEMRNDNDFALTLLPPSTFNQGCGPFECSTLIEPHTTRTTGDRSPFVQWFPRQALPDIHFGVLVKDLSRQSESLGTEVPVVREKDFYGTPFELLNVPTDPQFRAALRVYDLGTPTGIHVTIQPLSGNESLVDTFVFPAGKNPSFAQISDLVAAFPQLAGKGPLRITIEPPVIGAPTTWAFVSVTNNTTQDVTTISPQ